MSRKHHSEQAGRVYEWLNSKITQDVLAFLNKRQESIKAEMINLLADGTEFTDEDIRKMKILGLKRKHFRELISSLNAFIQNTLQE